MKHDWYDVARRAWDVLIDVAARGELTGYKELGDRVGVHYRSVRHALALIHDHCLAAHLPPLSVLVVNKDTRVPGTGFLAASRDHLDDAFRAVHAHEWGLVGNPFAFATPETPSEHLVHELLSPERRLETVGRLVATRGVGQRLFRDALLKAYGRRCAATGSTLESLLEAAHIVPWAKANLAERLDVQNGILLHVYVHRLLDHGLLSLERRHARALTLERRPRGPKLPAFDEQIAVAIVGKPLRLPKEPHHRPRSEYLARRVER